MTAMPAPRPRPRSPRALRVAERTAAASTRCAVSTSCIPAPVFVATAAAGRIAVRETDAEQFVHFVAGRVQRVQIGRLTFEAAGLPEIARWLTGFGGRAVAREPEELREMMRELHGEGLRAYEDEDA